ncbi:MAG TPA: DNA cytosine methyltransferase [bacterium]|nr:DNA cytosine methyltransferase [bacterium]HPQ65696.1 DNA cytosine methyltransferase [bacterium]
MIQLRIETDLSFTGNRKTAKGTEGMPTVIDLFCGVGGLTLGAARAGFQIAAAVDNNAQAKSAFKKNFPKYEYVDANIAELTGAELIEKAQIDINGIDGVIGGPPCQGFSRIGRRKPNDARNNLFDHFFRLVAELQPTFYIAENVLGIRDSQFDEVRANALARVANYINLGPIILKASDFGAATSRERVFFIGIVVGRANGLTKDCFAPPANVAKVNVGTALLGLRQKISPEWQQEAQSWRTVTPHNSGPFWERIRDKIPEGVGDLEAIRRLQDENRVSGCLGTRHTKTVLERFAKLAEGAIDGPSRAVRLARKGFCPTLRSGSDPEHGSYQALRPIHPTEPRVITPREAARLQGFPDWFQFDSTKWHSFRQIGNSISPILAESVLSRMKEFIE